MLWMRFKNLWKKKSCVKQYCEEEMVSKTDVANALDEVQKLVEKKILC